MKEKIMEDKIKTILSSYRPSKENLIKVLHDIQSAEPKQYISEEAMKLCAEYFKLTMAQVYGVVTYYSMFTTKPRGENHICLCKSPVCTNQGAQKNIDYLSDNYQLQNGKITDDGLLSLETVECLGRCGKAPSGMINNNVYTEITPEKLEKLISEIKNTKK
ncbi:MAG: NAD(P)H-dependent oxidoreductase subunit E [Bacteroidales bacterium]|nr:NAD(P)H-dependent oxidoreductase subunit E [Bacteroidales bacterium]